MAVLPPGRLLLTSCLRSRARGVCWQPRSSRYVTASPPTPRASSGPGVALRSKSTVTRVRSTYMEHGYGKCRRPASRWPRLPPAAPE
ncbi:hypothetical protein CMUS01_15597 [Colletotrichum musicola]|uniref:Uncharacterized protein n=1 Tax=Colletotrichum musicola TaxID=2175873 RepID=A0A8H6IV21_9PEZI|nr:hypothetical protein CMUS01_15597 [Colletotrichum musicola]